MYINTCINIFIYIYVYKYIYIQIFICTHLKKIYVYSYIGYSDYSILTAAMRGTRLVRLIKVMRDYKIESDLRKKRNQEMGKYLCTFIYDVRSLNVFLYM
jgi:hypothetical protein